MKPSDAKHYRAEARKCREAAAMAKDSAARLRWQQAERCWLTLANQTEVCVTFWRATISPHNFETEIGFSSNVVCDCLRALQTREPIPARDET